MKVLMVHNFYGSDAPSGENQVYELEKAAETNGNKIREFKRHSDVIIKKVCLVLYMGPW